MKVKEMVKKGIFSKDWVNGLKAGIKLSSQVAEQQGYEISFSDINELEIERDTEVAKSEPKTFEEEIKQDNERLNEIYDKVAGEAP